MKKIVEYNIVKEYSEVGLVTTVNEEIEEGWQPKGGMAVIHIPHPGMFEFFQVLVKYEEDS